MENLQTVIDSLLARYNPDTVILYGSFADGSTGSDSEFDALLKADVPETIHDTSVLNGIQLDVFVYPTSAEPSPEEILPIYHGRVLLDKTGKGKDLYEKVRAYVENYPRKTEEEVKSELSWCEKMLLRSRRTDVEGNFRWHWVLCDSLDIYCDLRRQFYFGPKKALRWMEESDPEGFRIYAQALSGMDHVSLENLIGYMKILGYG